MPTEKAHGIQIIKTCSALADQGISVTLLLPKKFNQVKEDIFDYYKVKKNFEIKRILSIDLIHLGFLLGKFGFWLESWFYALRVKRIILKEKPDIIYTREHIIAWLVGKFYKNVFLEVHVFPQSSFYKKCLAKVKGLIVITKKLKELHQKLNQEVLVAADGVDLEQFDIELSQTEARKQLDLPLDKKIVLYTGHLYQWKGAEVLAQASKHLPDDYQIYFTGGTQSDIIRFKSEIKSADLQVNIVGHRPYKEMPIWLKAADVLVITGNPKAAISQHYTSPMKLFEYMASKRPIVASNMPSFREVLNEQNSVIVKAGDSQAMAEGIKKAWENQGLAESLFKQAYYDVQEYSWEKRAMKIKGFINELMTKEGLKV